MFTAFFFEASVVALSQKKSSDRSEVSLLFTKMVERQFVSVFSFHCLKCFSDKCSATSGAAVRTTETSRCFRLFIALCLTSYPRRPSFSSTSALLWLWLTHFCSSPRSSCADSSRDWKRSWFYSDRDAGFEPDQDWPLWPRSEVMFTRSQSGLSEQTGQDSYDFLTQKIIRP